ncbi:hypothetical protein L7F22_027369 [Adiantum nelumboides]|nr:hypothetical protein [Adiantum nelumboides]
MLSKVDKESIVIYSFLTELVQKFDYQTFIRTSNFYEVDTRYSMARDAISGSMYEGSQHEYMVHAYNRNGLCGVVFVDAQYPMRSAFSVLTKVLDEYQKAFGNSWQNVQSDNSDTWPYLDEALGKYQDPTEADKLLKIQKELDETKHILHKTIDSVLERGEKLDSLVEKSSDLSLASQVFYKQAKKTNQCCTIL